jgi:hypothetical protein
MTRAPVIPITTRAKELLTVMTGSRLAASLFERKMRRRQENSMQTLLQAGQSKARFTHPKFAVERGGFHWLEDRVAGEQLLSVLEEERPPSCGEIALDQSQNVRCPNCESPLWNWNTNSPIVDACGFESYSLRCDECEAQLGGIVDPEDDQLLLVRL